MMVERPCPAFAHPGPIERWIDHHIFRQQRKYKCPNCGGHHLKEPQEEPMARHTPSRKLISSDPKSPLRGEALQARLQEHAARILETTLKRRNWTANLRDQLARDLELVLLKESRLPRD